MSKANPTEEEQKEMNEAFKSTSLSERAKLGFIMISISELTAIHMSLKKDEKYIADFYNDFNETLAAKGGDFTKKTKGAIYANTLMARAFNKRNLQSKGGKKGMSNRYNNKGETNENN